MMVFHWSLSDNRSPQESRTFRIILAGLSCRLDCLHLTSYFQVLLSFYQNFEFDDILLRHYNTVYNQSTVARWTRMHPPFPSEVWHWNSQELPMYNPKIHRDKNLQCSTTQPHRSQNWEDTKEEPKWLSETSIHITNYDYPSNSR